MKLISALILSAFLILAELDCANGLSEKCADDIVLEIVRNSKNNTPTEYNNLLIKGNLNFGNLNISSKNIEPSKYEQNYLGIISKNVSIINSPIIIDNSTIEGNVDFSDAQFQDITITNTILNDVNFNGASFNSADFENSTFNGNSSFIASSFYERAGFYKTKFIGLVDFDGSDIENGYFTESTFASSASFKNSVFKSVSFDKSKFFGPADFSDSSFGVASFVNSNFNQSTSFKYSRFENDASFRQSKFNGPASFVGTNFSGAFSLEYSTFSKNGDFSDVVVKILNLDDTNIEEFYSNWDVAKSKLSLTDNNRKIRIYNRLRENYLESNLLDEANDCYYEIMKIKGDINKDDPILTFIDISQRILYGYGMKPHYPLALSFVFITIFSILFSLIGIKKPILFSYNVFLSGTGKLLVEAPDLPEDSTDLAILLYNLERFLGLLLFSLFLIAITKSATL